MIFTWPLWLILIIPIVVAFWLRPLRTRGLTVLHAITLGLLLLALCGLSIVLPSRNGCIVLVADRSLSMPVGSQDQQTEAAELLYRAMGAGDELAVVSFGQRAAVEQPPQHARFSGFVNDVGSEASNLAEGLERAISLIPRDSPGASCWFPTATRPAATWRRPRPARRAPALRSIIARWAGRQPATWRSTTSTRRRR